jgi:hypothetical protein
MTRARRCRWGLALAVLVLSQAVPAPALAQGTDKGPQRYAFEMRERPWLGDNSVLQWLSTKTGLPINNTTEKPLGSLTFVAPNPGGKRAPQTYTIPEIIDLLNEALLPQKLLLVRCNSTITIIKADAALDNVRIPILTLEELEGRGKTELAWVCLHWPFLDSDLCAAEFRRLLSRFGQVVPLPTLSMVKVCDQAGTLREVIRLINAIDGRGNPGVITLHHQCITIPAEEAAETIRKFLGQQQRLRGQPFSVDVEERLNTVIVTGHPEQVAKAKEILKEIDIGAGDVRRGGDPILMRIEVPAGNAADVARALSEIYKKSPQVKVSAVNPNAIVAYADPAIQFKIQEFIEQTKATVTIPLTNLGAVKVAALLKLPRANVKDVPYIEADPLRNAILVRGKPQQIADIRAVIAQLEPPAAAEEYNRRAGINPGSKPLMPQVQGKP